MSVSTHHYPTARVPRPARPAVDRTRGRDERSESHQSSTTVLAEPSAPSGECQEARATAGARADGPRAPRCSPLSASRPPCGRGPWQRARTAVRQVRAWPCGGHRAVPVAPWRSGGGAPEDRLIRRQPQRRADDSTVRVSLGMDDRPSRHPASTPRLRRSAASRRRPAAAGPAGARAPTGRGVRGGRSLPKGVGSPGPSWQCHHFI